VQAANDRPDHPIATTTISTAKAADGSGISASNNRRGVGYVYSSNHTTDDDARAVLYDYLGAAGEGLDLTGS